MLCNPLLPRHLLIKQETEHAHPETKHAQTETEHAQNTFFKAGQNMRG